ncbi:SMI1/KNR4 family protein [Pedobacter sp. P26]|uniref:SMI1/KNR4 family protein n=1 Tax=Pedobacter sp. P26 TaxID=3423956 RepID=UPI003D672C39
MHPSITDIIVRIKAEKEELGITLYAPASSTEISDFENSIGIKLPDDLVKFYSFSNGFESGEDMFRVIPLDEIIDNIEQPDTYAVEQNDFHFAEYLIYSDMWTININPVDRNDYHIYNKVENVITLTNSFPKFLETFLTSGVFDGLYTWRENIERLQK